MSGTPAPDAPANTERSPRRGMCAAVLSLEAIALALGHRHGPPAAAGEQPRCGDVGPGAAVAGVSFDAIGKSEQRQLVQALIGLAQERRRSPEVCGYDSETSHLDQRGGLVAVAAGRGTSAASLETEARTRWSAVGGRVGG